MELIDGPLPLEQLVLRRLRISGDKTLHQLHELLCHAYDRRSDRAYEFLFGAPYELDARRFTGVVEPLLEDEPLCETQRTRLDELDLGGGQVFGYISDFDAQWIHRISVIAIGEGGSAADICERIGPSPPRHRRRMGRRPVGRRKLGATG